MSSSSKNAIYSSGLSTSTSLGSKTPSPNRVKPRTTSRPDATTFQKQNDKVAYCMGMGLGYLEKNEWISGRCDYKGNKRPFILVGCSVGSDTKKKGWNPTKTEECLGVLDVQVCPSLSIFVLIHDY